MSPDSPDPIENLKASLQNWADTTRGNAAVGFVEGLFNSVLVASPIIDKFSTWLLAGTGATAALIIANLDQLAPVIGLSNIRFAIHILIVSALFGALAKYKAINCQAIHAMQQELKQHLIPIFEQYQNDEAEITSMANEHNIAVKADIDLEFIQREYSRAFPKIMHWWLKKQFEIGLNDRLALGRKTARSLLWQGHYTVLQFFCFLWFAYVAVSNLNERSDR